MAESSLLPDEFVQHLMAVGQVDVLVGIPTLDNAATIADVVKIVHRGFAKHFPRDRTVLINSDGGSKDETREIVRTLSLDDTDTITVSHSLRTTHRITTPYHGVPGKGSALRQIFAAADLLQARAVAILDADVTTVSPDWLAALLSPVRQQAYEFVAPIYARHPLEGPLVTQLIRPLWRAVHGTQVAEPQAAEFGCSGRFAAHCLEQPVWDTGLAQYGIDIWITGEALAGGFTCCRAALVRAPSRRARHAQAWRPPSSRSSARLPVPGAAGDALDGADGVGAPARRGTAAAGCSTALVDPRRDTVDADTGVAVRGLGAAVPRRPVGGHGTSSLPRTTGAGRDAARARDAGSCCRCIWAAPVRSSWSTRITRRRRSRRPSKRSPWRSSGPNPIWSNGGTRPARGESWLR
ncbi:MAG: glycosyltransferase [Vicinamibacterales bacterium]